MTAPDSLLNADGEFISGKFKVQDLDIDNITLEDIPDFTGAMLDALKKLQVEDKNGHSSTDDDIRTLQLLRSADYMRDQVGDGIQDEKQAAIALQSYARALLGE